MAVVLAELELYRDLWCSLLSSSGGTTAGAAQVRWTLGCAPSFGSLDQGASVAGRIGAPGRGIDPIEQAKDLAAQRLLAGGQLELEWIAKDISSVTLAEAATREAKRLITVIFVPPHGEGAHQPGDLPVPPPRMHAVQHDPIRSASTSS